MNTAFAPVLGALIGALAGIGGGLLTGQRQARLEREKWLRGVHDAFANELRSTVKELTTDLASATHSMCWLCWLAKHGADRLTPLRLDAYDEEMHRLLPRIAGLHAMIAGMDREVHLRLRDLVDHVYKLDALIGQAALSFASGQPASATELAAHHDVSLKLEEELPAVVAEALRPYAIAALHR